MMSWVAADEGGSDPSSVPPDLDQITDEEFLKQLWQQAEDFSDRRRIRARMYKLREKRLREMVQNDEESLGALTMTDDDVCVVAGDSNYQSSSVTESETVKKESESSGRKSSVEIKTVYNSCDSSSRSGGSTMQGVESLREGRQAPSDEEIIDDRIREVSKGRGTRYQQTLNKYDQSGSDENSSVSISKSNYSIQSNAFTGDSFQSMKHKEVRDSVSPTRGAFDRKHIVDESETFFTSDEEAALKTESDAIIENLKSRKASREEKSTSRTSTSQRITERKLSKDLDISPTRKPSDKTSPTSRKTLELSLNKGMTSRKQPGQKDSPTSPTKTSSGRKSPLTGGARSPTGKRTKLDQIAQQMDKSLKKEYQKLDKYINENVDNSDEIINEEEEEAEDESGNIVKMIVQTRKKKDGTEIISRRVARSMKIVERESDIDEILVGNPEHEVLSRDVEETKETDGSKIKVITETRRRPDGIEYTTKNVLKTSKIFDYDHPEDIAYSENDELIGSEESTETDVNGITIRTVIETRRKKDGIEYTTKKVYKTSKVDTTITPSDDDVILDSEEIEEKQSDGTILKVVIEKRRTKEGQEYTHRQVYRSRKMTLSGIDLLKGMPSMNNDDEIIDKKEKEEYDENRSKIKVVTETRRRKDGSTYSFDYVLRTFKGTESDIEKMSINTSNTSNINVSDNDKLIKEDVKEEVQKDGSIVRTIIERRRAKDGTEYLRHRIMKIPKLPEPQLVVGSLDDEVLEGDIKEKVLEDGTHCKAITERRRSSTTGIQYTLRRMSKVYQHQPHIIQGTDEILDENVTEEEAGNGVMVKTIIRRYQRPDGNVYTTHDIQKSYKNPVSVSVEGNENDELIDRSYDERETNDGYILKTIMETRCRSDGTHYTVERMEKVSKLGDEVQVSFRGKSITSGSPGDTVVSYEEHEEPSDDGTVVKTILEVRKRTDGTEYTNKTTIKSTNVLIPEHETSYVIIKADSKEDEKNCSFFPSLDDEIVYTRKKKDVDERGKPITIIIETRKSKTTGEKYNLTKKVHTTDVVMTEQGEKILSRKPTFPKEIKSRKPRETGRYTETVPEESVPVVKSRFSPPSKTLSRPTMGSSRTNKKTIQEEPTPSPSKTVSPVRKSTRSPDKRSSERPQSGEDSEPSSPKSRLVKQPAKRTPSSETRPQDKYSRKPTSTELREKEANKPKDSFISRDKPSPTYSSRSSPDSKTKPVTRSTPRKKIERNSDSSPDQRSGSDSPGKESPKRTTRPRSELSRTDSKPKMPAERVHSSPKRGRSPLRSENLTPRDVTPSRSCCKKSPEQESPPLLKNKSATSVLRKRPSEETMKPNGDTRKLPSKFNKDIPKKLDMDKFSKYERPSVGTNKTSKSPDKKPTPSNDRTVKRPSKLSDKELTPKGNKPKDSQEPIVSLPETPLTEEMKAYPSSASPFIEDVSTEPDLPYQAVHRPSLVREPSEYPEDPSPSEAKPEKDEPSKSSSRRDPKPLSNKEPLNSKPSRKTSDTGPSSSSEDDSRRSPVQRKISPKIDADKDRKPSNETPRSFEKKPSSQRFGGTEPEPNDDRPSKRNEPQTRNQYSPKRGNISDDLIKSVSSQIISDDEKLEPTRKYTPRDKPNEPRKSSVEMRNSVSSKLSLFENPTPEPKEKEPLVRKRDTPSQKTEKLVPVKEPLIIPKYIHPLGSDTEEDEKKSPKLQDDGKLSSTRLVMSAMGTEPKPRKNPRPTYNDDDYFNDIPSKEKSEEEDTVTPLRGRSISPLSKERPRSKEGSPAPFIKEDSPGRFITGKPIDQGPNTSKIKRLERSNSNKKMIYEDLEINAANLPTYLKDIEYITDITVLEKLLQKAETYEERRIIRGHIRTLKKTDSQNVRPISNAPYKRFVDSTTPSKSSPVSSPFLSRRTTTTTTTSTTTTTNTRRKSSSTTETTRSTRKSSVEDVKSVRKTSGRVVNGTRKQSSDESSSSRRSSVEESMTQRKYSNGVTSKGSRKSSLEEPSSPKIRTTTKSPLESTPGSRFRKVSPDETPKFRKISDDSPKYKKTTDNNTTRYGKTPTEEDTTSYRKISTDKSSTYRKTSDITSKYRRTSPDDSSRNRETSPSDSSRYRKPYPNDTSKPRRVSPSETSRYRKPSDDTSKPRKVSPSDSSRYRKSSPDDTSNIRKTSPNDTSRYRKISPSDTTKYREVSPEETPKYRKPSSETPKRKPMSPGSKEITVNPLDEATSRRKPSPDTTSRVRKLSPDESPRETKKPSEPKTLRKTSKPTRDSSPEYETPTRKPHDTKSTRRPSYENEPTKRTSVKEEPKEKFSRDTRTKPTKDEPKKFGSRPSTDKMTTPEPSRPKEVTSTTRRFTDKPETKSTPSRFDRTPVKTTGRDFRSTPSKDTPKTKETPQDSQPYVEPLRHQRTVARTNLIQTDVEKIVSPYGVGPTDENGIPLFGLKALKRRTQQPVAPPPEETEPAKVEEEFVPSDSLGKPLFGIRSVRKSPPETTAYTTTHVAKETTAVQKKFQTASATTESTHLATSVVSQPRTHTTEVVTSPNHNTPSAHDDTPSTDVSSDDSQTGTPKMAERRQRRTRRKESHASKSRTSTEEEEEEEDDVNGVYSRSTNRYTKRYPYSEPEGTHGKPSTGETSPSLVKSIDQSLRRKTSTSGSENDTNEKTVSLKDIIKLHESKVVADINETDSPSRIKPKKILRDSFEPTHEQPESRPHRTWDLETDLSSRSQVMGNIIAKHETLTKQDSFKSEKKLTGILKKTSTASVQSSKLATSSDSERDEIMDRSERMYSPDRSDSPSRDSGESKKVERKTSYTEIKLSRPSTSDKCTVEKSSSATVDADSKSKFSTSRVSPLRRGNDDWSDSVSASDVTRKEGRSFLHDRSKVTGITDVLSRMEASEAVDHEAKVTSDDQARSLLNKFLGAQVLMTGVESMMANASGSQTSSHTSMTYDNDGKMSMTRNVSGEQVTKTLKDGDVTENRKTFSTGPQTVTYTSSSASPKVESDIVKGVNINEVTDDFALNQLLDSCEEYDERRRVRMRLKALLAEKKALQKQLSGHERGEINSSSRRTAGVAGSNLRSSEGNSSFSFSRGSSQVTTQKSNFSSTYSSQNSSRSFQSGKDARGGSAFDKFKQLDSNKQNQSGQGPAVSGPLFQLSTSLNRSASGVKDMILTWCQCRTRDYQGVKIENFSTSWNDGLAFCALIHHFYPDAFDFKSLNPKNRRHNFALAFRVADEKAGVMALLDVDDMVMMKKPDWKCVFTYVQSLYKRLKDE